MSTYPKGSEWRLWDLHIHTPASYNYTGGSFSTMSAEEKDAAITQIISNINESDVAAYAINDYWTFDGYLALRTAHLAGKTINKTVFPAIELRIESASKHRLNIHVILSDKLSIQQLNDFKGQLRLRLIDRPLSDEALIEYARQLDGAKAKIHGAQEGYLDDPVALARIGAETAEITKASFEAALKTVPEDHRLVMAPYDCYGGMAKIDWKVQPSEDLFFMRLVDIVEDRDRENIDLFACRKSPANEAFITNFQVTIGGRPKPCVSGSDGHSIAAFKTWRKETKTKKTWIKADPTFEGLRQIIFEPTARVCVQETCPAANYTKPFLSSVSIAHEFSPFPLNPLYENPRFGAEPGLFLNSDLVCVIGGRGTGKSCLVDYLGKAFGPATKTRPYVLSEHFAVVFNKDLASTSTHHAKEEAELPFVYISQNEVKTKVTTGTVGDEIKQMLGIQGLSFDSEVDSKTHDILTDVEKQKDWFKQTNEKGELIYDKASIESQISRNQSLLDSITTEKNKEKLERFTTNVSKISGAKEKTRRLSLLKEELEAFKTSFDPKAMVIDPTIPLLDITAQVEAIRLLTEQAGAEIAAYEEDNAKIRADFALVYTGDLSGLLQNAESYRSAIEKLKSSLTTIETKQNELDAAVAKRVTIPSLIEKEIIRQKDAIDERWKAIQQGQPDWTQEQKDLMKRILADRQITLEGRIIFDQTLFLTQLKEVLNLRSFRASAGRSSEDKILEMFPISDSTSFLKFMQEQLHIIEDEGFVSGDLSSLFYDVAQRSAFLRVEPVISYGGRPLERLSVGQKGTVYLCLKLATQAFTQPLIFDQPEDDLDNEFIIEELVEIFRGIKQFRQVILVTHNANLVVNADAEQVVVAENANGVLKYISGSLEAEVTNKAVRRILEGGDEAFLKRELRYNLK
jgi:energy-coupling factor transporter ATP-binding protein EcfA2